MRCFNDKKLKKEQNLKNKKLINLEEIKNKNRIKEIKNKMKKLFFIILLILLGMFMFSSVMFASAQETEKDVCVVYFTGVGCSHCARTDPVVLINITKEHSNFIVIEYEIYHQKENAPLILDYNSKYNTGLGIPLIIFEHDYKVGDSPILQNINSLLEKSSKCLLLDGSASFSEIDITKLPGKPKLWVAERILIKTTGGNNNQLLKSLLTIAEENLSSVVKDINYKVVEPEKVALSGKNVEFENAIQINGWIFQWNGKAIETGKCPSCPEPGEWSECVNETKTRTNYKCSEETDFKCVSYIEITECEVENGEGVEKLTMAKLISLAAVDAINPCALAVLTLMLIAILSYNPRKKRNILLAGLAFTFSVFIMYLFYGLVIIKFFQIVQALTAIRIWLYKILGVGAMILGVLNIKDFIKYRPGGICTEMPLKMRPKVQKIISGITSPKGAFCVGIFVTLFLLPCTIGPYIIAGGILSALELIKTIPPLLLYNLIFVLPMLIITIAVYSGFAKIEDVSGWKEKNIRTLHLIAGIIMFALGLAMTAGWV